MEENNGLEYSSDSTIVVMLPCAWGEEQKFQEMKAPEITQLMRLNDTRMKSLVDYEYKVEKAQEYLIENYEELGDHADEIAELLGIELQQTVSFEMTVTITGSITVPVGKSLWELSEYDFDIDLTCSNSDYELEEYDVTDFNLEEA